MATRGFSLRRLLLGDPLASAQIAHEKLPKVRALAVFSSDALSSVAYATEEILFVLAAAGVAALDLVVPISLAIAALLLIVGLSYFQTVHAYPQGGGAYAVAKENLGIFPGLVAGAALLIDYTLTVAVSISAGVAALSSWLPALLPYRMVLAVSVVALITIINLRGLRESSTIFSVPTYLFLGGILFMLAYGAFRWFTSGSLPQVTVANPTHADIIVNGIGLFFILRAFSAGCTALTGIEAISDGVPSFREPEAENAGKTLLVMIALLGTMFIGLSLLAHQVGAMPSHEETVLSQIGRALFGQGPLYVAVQIATALILILAANTAYSDFPRLAFRMSQDGFLPRPMANVGDRLVFSNGILMLGALASVLIFVFHGETHRLLPLYAVGVFLSFTLSQLGMVRRWLRLRTPGWWRNAAINVTGGVTTLVVFVIILATRFIAGAWIVVLLTCLLVALFLRIRLHYRQLASQLSLENFATPTRLHHLRVVMPIGGVHRGVIKALEFARSLSPDVTAVFIESSEEEGRRVREKWETWGDGIRLVTIPSPYRSIIEPLISYLDRLEEERQARDIIAVVLPQFVPARWWENLLHNQTAWLIRLSLLFREGFIVIDVPYHIV